VKICIDDFKKALIKAGEGSKADIRAMQVDHHFLIQILFNHRALAWESFGLDITILLIQRLILIHPRIKGMTMHRNEA
jgi:hypothetical protein